MSEISTVQEETIKAHQEIATRNSRAAINTAERTRDELTSRLAQLERVCIAHQQEIEDMRRKMNLMLSERFNGRSTTPGE